MHNVLKNHKYDSRRRIVLKTGLISFQDTRIGCFVLNISAGGAGLVVESDAAIPFSFDLEIGDERIRRRCLVVWRNDRQIGVGIRFGPGRPQGTAWLAIPVQPAPTQVKSGAITNRLTCPLAKPVPACIRSGDCPSTANGTTLDPDSRYQTLA